MDGKTRSAVARNVLALRKEHRWSQLELSRRSGIAQTAISYIEDPAGKSPTLDSLAALALAFRVPAWALLLDDLPSENVAKRLESLVATYTAIGEPGRRTVDAIAEAESRYSRGREDDTD